MAKSTKKTRSKDKAGKPLIVNPDMSNVVPLVRRGNQVLLDLNIPAKPPEIGDSIKKPAGYALKKLCEENGIDPYLYDSQELRSKIRKLDQSDTMVKIFCIMQTVFWEVAYDGLKYHKGPVH